MTYYVNLEVQTTQKLTAAQQDRLRGAILAAIDEASRAKKIPYDADTVTATVEVQ